MPKTSIIIPTRNRPHLVPRAVLSARASGTDVEVIVVDDASSGETARVCKTLSGITYIRAERNLGLGGARNIGLVASGGEYISFLDDDDMRLPNSLDRQIEILSKEPSAGLIYGQALFEDQDGQPQHRWYPLECPQGDLFWKLLTRNFIPCGSVVFRRSCLLRVGLLDEGIPGLEDWDLWVRISEIYPIISIETPVTQYRQSTPASGQFTSNAAQLVSLGLRQFRECWVNLPRVAAASPKERQDAWRDLSRNMVAHLLWESVRAVRFRQMNQALKNLLIITRLHPLAITRILKDLLSGLARTKLRDSWNGAMSNADRVENRASSKL
jgi:glycosyltransferase involved in cell wall biosynthesis